MAYVIFVKYFIMIYCSLYISTKLVNLNKWKFHLVFFSCSLGIGRLYCLIPSRYTGFTFFISIITMCLIIKLIYHFSLFITFYITILSVAMSHSLYLISSIATACIGILLFPQIVEDILARQMIELLLHFAFVFLLFKIKRIKRGMPFLINEQSNGNKTGIYLSFVIILSLTLIKLTNIEAISIITILMILLCFYLLYTWWLQRIKTTYMERMTRKELEFLNNEITSLKQDNEILSALVHKDNKIVPSLIMAVKDYIAGVQNDHSAKIDIALGNEIIQNLETLLLERQNTIHSCVSFNLPIVKTNVISIDALMNYMVQKASHYNITIHFDYHFSNTSCNLKKMLSNCISESELCTLLADLIDNAIIATNCNHHSNIMVKIFSDSENQYVIEVWDSGIPFEAEVIVNLGRKRITTHKDFGTGIGLNTIYHITSTHNASIMIDETVTEEMYTKKMSVIFDNQHSYILKTNTRAEEFHYLKKRIDLQIESFSS